jgi:molybdopterin molybdotransferase
MNSTLPNCDNASNLLSVEQALSSIISTITPLTLTERVSLHASLGRILADPIVSTLEIPAFRNSAMDGYAAKFSDLSLEEPQSLKLVGKSFAGHPFTGTLNVGECIRIMTGAVVPNGADTVIMQEQTSADGDIITFPTVKEAGQNIRMPGEDVKLGESLLESGTQINAANLGLLASLGLSEIDVIRKPRVAIFSTGDELKGVGTPLKQGEIYDSNRYTLFGMLKKLDVDILDMGVIPDNEEAVEKAFLKASQISDVLITSGGVSVGDADFISSTLKKLGKVNFWKIAMKPGKPLAFGQLGNCQFFGLPGNPVSVMATFMLFVRPAILKMKGQPEDAYKTRTLEAICDVDLKKAPGRKDHQRGIYYTDDNNLLHVTTVGLQSSHVLSAMSKANCFIALERESGDIAAKTKVQIIPFSELL